MLYHAGSVFANNYLVTLMHIAMETYCAAGVSREIAQQMAASLAKQGVDNVLAVGTKNALTGPIARGDMDTVHAQQQQVELWNTEAGALYQAFIPLTVHLAALSDDIQLKNHSEK